MARLLHLAMLASAVLLGACEREAAPLPTEPPGPAARPKLEFPAIYQGRWAQDAAACAIEGHESRLEISPTELRFHESMGVVRAMDLSVMDTATVDADFEGEGERWSRKLTLALFGTPDDLTLTITDPEGTSFKRVRCPAA